MKILIGTPIHECKDYAMERWLQNVAKLQKNTLTDLLLVDNSPTSGYVKKVKGYCEKYGITNYKVQHLEIDQKLGADLRIEASQETIRQYALFHNYDCWFSWECDQIAPNDTLDKLIKIMKEGNYRMVIHNSRARWDPSIHNVNMGITLISKECLEKCWFLPQKNGKISLDLSDSYNINNPSVFKKRVLKSGGNYLEAYGIIGPIYHLNNNL
jgi:hypothetical protein